MSGRDISYDACQLSTSIKDPSQGDLQYANRVVRKIRGSEPINLKFPVLKGKLKIHVYADASLGNLPCGGTQGGYIILLTGSDSATKFSLLSWKSTKLKRIVKSTLAAETMALGEGLDAGLYLQAMFLDVLSEKPLLEIVTDSKSLYNSVNSNLSNFKEKILRIEIACIRESLERREVETLR